MSRYTFAPKAKLDLEDIHSYICQESVAAAGKLQEIFYEKFRLLDSQPLMGELRVLQTSECSLPAATSSLYLPKKDGVKILQIVHSAQDLEAISPRSVTERNRD